MKMLACRCASRLEYAKISRLSGIFRVTVQNYVSFLEQTYLIFRVPVLARNFDREIVKAKKVYFCDNDILNALGNVSSGVKFENAVFNQLRHKGEVSYYALKTGREIDFILDKKIAFEAKESPDISDLSALKELSALAGLKEARLIGRNSVPNFRDYIWAGDIR